MMFLGCFLLFLFLTISHKIRNEITFMFLQIMVVSRRPQETTRLVVKRSPRRQSEFTKYYKQ